MKLISENSRIFKYLFLTCFVGVMIFLLINFDIKSLLINALHWIEELGPFGPLIFIGIYIVACVLFIPGTILTLGAGAIFGVGLGSVYVSIAATLGATAAFLVGRYFARDMVAKKIEGNASFNSIDEAVAKEGWKIVGLIRLSPLFPFNLLNYAFGLTKVHLKDYFFGSWIGMIPGTIMFVYLGALAGDIASVATGMSDRAKTPAEWALYVVGLIATVIVTIYVTKIAKKALASKVPSTSTVEEKV